MEGLPKKDPGTDRFVGLSPDGEHFARYFQEQSILSDQILSQFERPKNLEEIKVIAEIFKRIPEFIKEYGAEAHKVFSVDSVHILDRTAEQNEKVKEYLEKGISGKYSHYLERIEVLVEEGDYLNLAKTLIHEAIHANSFFSIEGKEMPNESFSPALTSRRLGLTTVQNEENHMFKYMNEALTEELAKRFCNKYFDSIEELKDAHKENNSKKFQNPTRNDAPLWDVILEKLDLGEGYAYLNERIDFTAFALMIYEKNKDKFNEFEDVIKMFSKAMFTGRILEIARLTDRTFGDGTFRKIGIHYLHPSQDVTLEQVKEWITVKKAA